MILYNSPINHPQSLNDEKTKGVNGMAQMQLELEGTTLAKEVICALVKAGALKLPEDGQEFVGSVGVRMCRRGNTLTVALVKPPTKPQAGTKEFDLTDFFRR